jgi:glycosyltransferase involved in cell wall biosynthesis
MNRNKEIKIFTLYPYPKSGGCFKQLIRSIGALSESGIKVHYLSAKKFSLDSYKNVTFHRFPFFISNEIIFYLLFYLLAPFYALGIILRNKIDKALMFNEEFAALLFFAKLFCSIKTILIVEGFMGTFAKSKKFSTPIRFFLKIYGKIGIHLSEKIFTVSNDLKNRIQKFYNSHREIKIFYNYPLKKEIKQAKKIDLSRDFDIKDKSFIISCVSSLIPRKNISYLIDEFSQAGDSNSCLLIIGSGPEKPNLIKKVVKKGQSKRILFAGQREDALNIIKSSDLVVLPTLHDDCPLVVIESLQLGIACIASKRGGIPEVLKYDELMFDIGRQGELTQKINRITENPDYFKKIKEYTLERGSLFNKDWKQEIIKVVNE